MPTGTILVCEGTTEDGDCCRRADVLPSDLSFDAARGWISLRSRPFVGGDHTQDRHILLCPSCAARTAHSGIRSDVATALERSPGNLAP